MEKFETKNYNGHQLAIVFHDGGNKNVVIFCHGYRCSSIGPSRLFVKIARELVNKKISSLRFDQFGSGNSEGDFYDSSFNDWVATTKALADDFIAKGYRVALFGQSMGGATVIDAASQIPGISAAVAWVPDPCVDTFRHPNDTFVEENGQRVKIRYWQEAHDAKLAEKLRLVAAPMYVVQCSNDEYVSAENHAAIEKNSQRHHTVEMFEGLTHSNWTHEQAQEIVAKSIDFLVKNLNFK